MNLRPGLRPRQAFRPTRSVVTHAELMRAFEEFKETNDRKIAEKRSIDVVLEEKIARIDNTITTQPRGSMLLNSSNRAPSPDRCR